MGAAWFEEEKSFADSGLWAGIVICHPASPDSLHAGVLHRGKDGAASVIHLGWEDNVGNSWRWGRLWASPDAEPETLRVAAACCRNVLAVFSATGKFPYGLTYRGTKFDLDGHLQLADRARGLSCATFALAIFESVGVTLVEEATWPVRKAEDALFLDRVSKFGPDEVIAALKKEIAEGVRRIQPQEVVGACNCKLPATFSSASEEGTIVLAKLKSALQPPLPSS